MTSFNYCIADTNKPYWVWGPLVFTGFYFLPIITNFSELVAFNFFTIITLYVGFLFLYYKAIHAKGEKVLIWLLALTLLVSLGTYINYGTQSLFGYIAFIAGFNLSLKKSNTVLFVLSIAILLSSYFFTSFNPYFYIPALLMSLGLFVFGASTQRDIKHQIKETRSQQQIEQLAIIAERERIARDLHDLIGHSLSSIALKSELADKYLSLGQQAKAQQEINDVALLSRETLSEVRHAVSGLKKQNLSSSLEKLTSELINQKFEVLCSNKLKVLHAKTESTIVLLLTEAITNILRHSNGDKVTIDLLIKNNQIFIYINDNGQCKNYVQGNGLQGINERCQQLNGTLKVSTKNGFTLNIILPEVNTL